ncbi:MAG: TerC family protein [Gemmatimonadota bacterium]
MQELWVWVAFNLLILVFLAVDLGVFHREPHAIGVKEAGIWSAIWIALSLVFNYGVYQVLGTETGLEFLTGYLIEKSLSVDNIFVFVLIFSYFGVPREYQHRVLFWGILGALIMRGTLIAAGAFLIHRFDWIFYVFGAFLVATAIRMATQDEHDVEPEANPVIGLVRRLVPISRNYAGPQFFVREPIGRAGATRLVATPLLVVLIMVETTDLIFALDSIPAIFGITSDPFIVYSSNVFAILGLRALYFLLAGVIERFEYLKYGLALILGFVGFKMLLEDLIHVPILTSLAVIAGVLTASIVLSLVLEPPRPTAASPTAGPSGPEPGPGDSPDDI